MRAIPLFLLFASLAQAGDYDSGLTEEQLSQGWISLFDGETLFGWKANNNIDWHVEEGTIVASQGDPGLLCTTLEYARYELKCDFRLTESGNSGIFLQSEFSPKDPKIDCYELNLCDPREAFGTGSLVGVTEPEKKVKVGTEWHTYHVIVDENHIVVRLDDEQILDYTHKIENPRRKGFIGLQKNEGKIEFRKIHLRPLKSEALFDGKTLEGWRLVPGGVSTFDIEEGMIHVRNGRGYLETTKQYGDMTLQAEVKTNGKHLNSGIFFRALPGTKENPADGYECQIRHQWEGDDRTKPVDFGTGGIYRRIATRKVVSNDGEWCYLTLVAQGPRFSVWVNGYQTTDWVDTRKPNANPRQGLRLEPGHISLQGHDPTTDLSFRNLRIGE